MLPRYRRLFALALCLLALLPAACRGARSSRNTSAPAAPVAPADQDPGGGSATHTDTAAGDRSRARNAARSSPPAGRAEDAGTTPETAPAAEVPAAAGAPPPLPGTFWVMVENSPGAIPQDGLDRADWVFEVEAEGGITRFLAGFHRRPVAKIGPVRSVRVHFLQLLQPYGGPIAHAGGSADALDMLARNPAYQDMDEIYNAGAFFWRSQDRDPPHNLYTSTDLLLRGVNARSYRLQELTPEHQGSPPAGGQPATRIEVTFPLEYTRVEWRWAGETWQRHQNGVVHEMQDGAHIRPDTVVVMVASHYRTVYKDEWYRDIGVTGSGQAWFFRAGQVWSGTWHKPAVRDHLTFRRGETPFPLGQGPVWVQVIESPAALQWHP